MILQRDGRLQEEIRVHGCYLMCLLFFINKFTNFELSAESIDKGLFKLFVKRGWLNDKCYVLDPGAILNWGGVKCIYTDKYETPDRMCGDGEFEILYWRHTEVGGHFTCGDGHGRCTYDPWGVSKAASEGMLLSKRIFKRI